MDSLKMEEKDQIIAHEDTSLSDNQRVEDAFDHANDMHDRASGKGSLGILTDVAEKTNENHSAITGAKGAVKGAFGFVGNTWDVLANFMRDITPAVIVNNSSRATFAMKGAADVLSLWSGKKFGANYRTAASSITLACMGIGTVFREKSQTEEQLKSYKQMPITEYIPMRVKHAFDPANHITATVGLGTIANGVLTTVSGITQSQKDVKDAFGALGKGKFGPLKVLFGKNKVGGELWTGAMTVLAGSLMNFIPDQDRAWQLSTAVFLGRAWPAYKNASQAMWKGYPNVSNPRFPAGASAKNPFGGGKGAWKNHKTDFPGDWNAPPGDWQQMGKFGLNQGSNVFSGFYGGVEKQEDGTIIKVKKHPDIEDQPITRDELFKANPCDYCPSVKVKAGDVEDERVKEAPALKPKTA